MESSRKAFISQRVVLQDEIVPACVLVEDGKITNILTGNNMELGKSLAGVEVVNIGRHMLMPGIVDAHVHVNEPGRTAWEGYATATRAAAAGGLTTIVDMPLNCVPSTTSLSAFLCKESVAKGKCHIDVAFWGGIVPGNQKELIPMLNAGVMGFKCFLIHSGVDDFPHVERSDLESAFQVLQNTDAVVLFHAEVDCDCGHGSSVGGPKEYQTFLQSRPAVMEEEAINLVCELCLKYRVKCHIVHLSAASALPTIVAAKQRGAPLTVETCHHYLTLHAESVPNGNTLFKCCPPIREKTNQDLLWEGLKNRHIDMVVSDHSPCTPDLKELDKGDFMTAWGGISSIQFGLSLFWTGCQRRGMDVLDLVRLLCTNTAKLANLSHRKGTIKLGHDADFVIWNPEATFEVTQDMIEFKNKISPYVGRVLSGEVHTTIVRGIAVYDDGVFHKIPRGELVFNDTIKNKVEPTQSDKSQTFSDKITEAYVRSEIGKMLLTVEDEIAAAE